MKKRVLVAGMAHESDSFNPIIAGAADFPVFRGKEMLRRRVKNDATTGILDTLEAKGYEIIPAFFTHAVPNGLVDKGFYLSLKAELLETARQALREGPIGAVTLELHGSMTVKDFGEAEGPLLEELRALLPGVPILCALDMHATMTAKMHRNCDGFVAFKEAPHIDQYETGVQAADMTIAVLEEGVKPCSAWVKVPLLVAGEQSATNVEPMVSLMRAFRASEKKPGVLAASCLMGYPWCDSPDCSAGVYVTATDQETADAEALRLAGLLWDAREKFAFQTEAYPEQEAVEVALTAALEGGKGPVYLSDSGDNPTGGSSSDCTGLLRCLLEDERTTALPSPALYGGIYDPEATLRCRGKVGEELTLTFGAKFDRKTTRPITASGQVMAFLEDWQGSAAALFRVHNVDIVLAEKHIGYVDPHLFSALGREAGEAPLVCLKLGYLTPGHAALARRAILALSQGSTNEALETLHYEQIPRPIFPLDRRFEYTPKCEGIMQRSAAMPPTQERWNTDMKVVIIGGVAGGATAAARLRRLDEQAEIIVFERSGYVSYANCGLPYYIGGVIEDPEELTLQTPESFFARFRVEMRVRHEVTAIHPEKKTVSVKNLETGKEFEETYDKLLLSPGAKPTQPRLPGVGLEKLFTLRTVEDTFRIKDYISTHRPKSAVLAGGGFIGLELAENLRELGMEVTIVQRPKQLMNPFDPDMAAFIHSEVRRHGIKLALGHTVEGFEEKEGGVDVLLKDVPSLHADMVVLAIGVTPDTALAKDAGLVLGLKGSIVVNDRMETSVPDIYAVGDAVQVKHSVTGQDAVISLAGPANKQGRIAADNICGRDSHYPGSQGSSVIKVFDLTAAATGVNETNAQKAGLDADAVILSPMSHAGYYPGGKVMTMKVVFEKKTFRLLGAQIVGYEGVDKRIDVLSTAIHCGMKATDLKDLDLAYAPPYSSAKDPVNMAGFMVEDLADGTVKQFRLEDVDRLPRDGSVTLLDARTPREYDRGHVEGFRNIPVDELRERLGELEAGKPVYVMCQSGLRSYIACRILAGYGFDCYNFAGGFRFYDAVVNDRRLIEQATACGMDQD